jgi:hypothetical protein
VLAGLRQIVGHLQPQPGFRAAAERAEADPANAISPRPEVGFGSKAAVLGQA